MDDKAELRNIKNKEILKCAQCEKIITTSNYGLRKIKVKPETYIYVKFCIDCHKKYIET